eukprot:148506-Pyramimonas_sp.AAC.1
MDVDNPCSDRASHAGGEGVGTRSPQRPPPDSVEGLSQAERSQRDAFIDEVRRIRTRVASNSVTPGMRRSRILVPFIWGTATDRGRSVLEQAFTSSNISTAIIDQAAAWWRAQGVSSYRDAQLVLASETDISSRAAGATFEAPEAGGYISPLLQERMMLHL